MNVNPPRTFALVGPGRAGSCLALALVARGWRATAVAGRSEGSSTTRAAVARLGCPPRAVPEAGRGADLVLVTTPDTAISAIACALAPGLEPGALVVHCSGALGLEVLAALRSERPDVVVGALHPLQTFASADARVLDGVWAAIDGPLAVTDLAVELGLRPFVVDDASRALYHAAAVVASNHLVALLGQVTRLAGAAGVPAEAFWPLVRTSLANVEVHGPESVLTGPVARGDLPTVAAHVAALPAPERATYRALAREALTLTGRQDPDLLDLLDLSVVDPEVAA